MIATHGGDADQGHGYYSSPFQLKSASWDKDAYDHEQHSIISNSTGQSYVVPWSSSHNRNTGDDVENVYFQVGPRGDTEQLSVQAAGYAVPWCTAEDDNYDSRVATPQETYMDVSHIYSLAADESGSSASSRHGTVFQRPVQQRGFDFGSTHSVIKHNPLLFNSPAYTEDIDNENDDNKYPRHVYDLATRSKTNRIKERRHHDHDESDTTDL